ncbi:VWA domain-containing protein [Kiritimatiellaeota bacterium B1221]|nr:VWA domain-containing protein [Kiritimatiellaeota bacterium B1221]
MIHFAHPEAFLLIPLWGLGCWCLPKAGFLKPLRILLLLLVMLAWADPFLNRTRDGLDLWVLNDMSLSASESVQPGMAELESLLKESKGRNDELFFVDFADEAIVRDPLSAAVLGGRKDSTRIGNALQFTLSQLKENRNARLLLVSDGFSTDPLDLAGDRLLAEQVPLDIRLMAPELLQDVRVERIDAPLRTGRGDPFLVEARILGPSGGQAEAVLIRDGIELNRQTIVFRRGEARVKWTARLMQSGSAKFEVEVNAETDAYVDNNRQVHWVEAGGKSGILLLSAYEDDPLATILKADGKEVKHLTRFEDLNEGSLSGAGLLWIHNVHAADLPQKFLQGVSFYVREQGGGLIMTGGKSSFGSGGYFESPVDDLLPVSMELKEEDRKLSVAMAIVMDRSGSMSAGTAGGMSKMELANSGAARAIELMGEMDAVTVFAVDTAAHEILPLSQVGKHRGKLTSIVRRIQSTGGGIYVFNGLEAAWAELKNAPQETRHIILFSDAADSEQPEGVGRLIKEMVANNTTVSVIALGRPGDPDAPFLEQIAEDGQGRLFFNEDANTLPAVFAQETVSVSRSIFLEEPVGVEALAGWQELAAVSLDWPGQVDGYNLSYLREGASESLRSMDRYAAPLLAHWQRGSGRVAAVSMPLGGAFSETLRAWPQYGDFVRTLGRWSLRGDVPPGLALRLQRIGETLRVQLYADEVWQARFAEEAPELITMSNLEPEARPHVWRRIQPGWVQTDLPLVASERIQGAIRMGDHVLPFGPVNGMAGAEWEMNPQMAQQVRMLSERSHGVDRVDLAGIWDSPGRKSFQGTRHLWLWLCGGLFLVEAIWSRVGGQRIQWGIRSAPKDVKEVPPSKAQASKATVTEEAPAPRSAFSRAKDPRR